MIVLITGGTGLIGKALCSMLLNLNYQVRILSRSKKKNTTPGIKQFQWDIESYDIEQGAIKDVDYIINLAGENISEKKWTQKQKIIIKNSRVKSTQLLYQACLKENHWPKAFIASSAIGYYGTFTSEEILDENQKHGKDFLALVCKEWEDASNLFNKHTRTTIIRTGVVFSDKGAAFPKFLKPIKFGLGMALGSGKQYIPWIHIDDITGILIEAIKQDNLEGTYNGVAPSHITNKELVKKISGILKKPFFLPNLPPFLLKLIFGEMAGIFLEGTRVSTNKIQNAGYKFKYPDIESAIKNLVNN